jgi:hypothetical protein
MISTKNPSWMSQESQVLSVSPLNQVIAELERQFGSEIGNGRVDTFKLFTGDFTLLKIKKSLE